MCGRFSISKEEEQLEERFKSKWYTLALQKRYNVAPTDPAPVLSSIEPNRFTLMNWGIRPNWGSTSSQVLINARTESLLEKAVFRKAALHHHVLVLADGYFEWQVNGKVKTPYYIHFDDHRTFCMAGIFQETIHSDGSKIGCFSILTRPASKELASLHDRMPVILSPDEEENWLGSTYTNDEISRLILSLPAPKLCYYSVSAKINNARYDQPDVLTPYTPPPTLSLFD